MIGGHIVIDFRNGRERIVHHPMRSAGERVGQFRVPARGDRIVEGTARIGFDP